MQILTMAKLARSALNSDIEDATEHADHVLDAIMRIASTVVADLDAAQIEIEDARLRGREAARRGTVRSRQRCSTEFARGQAELQADGALAGSPISASSNESDGEVQQDLF